MIETCGRPIHEANERYFIGIWYAGKCQKKFIDYGTYLRVVEALAMVKFENYKHKVCIDAANLPVSKLYFDIDCMQCKRKKSAHSACLVDLVDARIAALRTLLIKLNRLLNISLTEQHLTVAIKSTGGCGMHVTVDVFVDFVARHLISTRMAGCCLDTTTTVTTTATDHPFNIVAGGPSEEYDCEEPSSRFVCDNPSNVLLPGGRGYDSLLNMRTQRAYELTMHDAINSAGVVVTSEQLRNCDHISVRIQSDPNLNGQPIEWVMCPTTTVGEAPNTLENTDAIMIAAAASSPPPSSLPPLACSVPMVTTTTTIGGGVYVVEEDEESATSNALIVSRVVLWERIKTFAHLNENTAHVIALRFHNYCVSVKWFVHSTLIISQAIVSHYHIKDCNSYPCTRISQVKLAPRHKTDAIVHHNTNSSSNEDSFVSNDSANDRSPPTNDSMLVGAKNFLNKFRVWCATANSQTTTTNGVVSGHDDSAPRRGCPTSMDIDGDLATAAASLEEFNAAVWSNRYPYTTEEIAWMERYRAPRTIHDGGDGGDRQLKLPTDHTLRLFQYAQLVFDWWTKEGSSVAATAAKLVDTLLSLKQANAATEGGVNGGKRKRAKKTNRPRSGGAAGDAPTDNNTVSDVASPGSTRAPTLLELISHALSKTSITATVSFLMRIAHCSVEDACLLTMLLDGGMDDAVAPVVDASPGVEFVLVRLATANKKLANYLLSAYHGCDLFYLFVHDKTQFPALVMLNLVLSADPDILMNDPSLKHLFCTYILNCSRAGDKTLIFDGNRMQFVNLKELRDITIPRTKLIDCECFYSYRCNYGIYNPYTRVMEAHGPSLTDLVWRDFATPPDLLTPSIAVHELALDYMSKVPSFIEHLQATALYHTLVAPLWPVYDTYPSIHEYYSRSNQQIESFAVSTFQTLLEDLTLIIQKHTIHPNIFPRHLFKHLHALPHLKRLILTMISVVFTLNTRFNIVYETPSMLISKLFGSDYWQCIGTQFHCTWNQKDNTVSKECRLDQTAVVEMAEDFTSDFNTAAEANTDPEGGGGGSHGVDTWGGDDGDVCNVAIIRRLLNIDQTKYELLTRVGNAVREFDASTIGGGSARDGMDSDLVQPVYERPTGGFQKSHVESVSETLEFFKRINVAPLLRENDAFGEDFLQRIDVTYKDVNLYTLLVTSWFIRMGDDHRLSTTPLFRYIDQHRRVLYEELCTLAAQLIPHGHLQCATSDALVEEFERFVDTMETITPTVYNDAFNVDTIIDFYEPNISHAARYAIKRRLIESVPRDVRSKLISALMELLRSTNYNVDLFVEFAKLIGYCEYLGNALRIGVNLYGMSGSGKTSLLNTLAKTFNTHMNSNLTSKQFKESITGDNDPNARTISMNFICHMNEENVVLVSRFKSYVDVGFLVTRDCHVTEVLEFPIRAKVVFCTNEPVQVENATDDGFHQRYYPIPLAYAFKDYEPGLDRLIRHRVENLTPSLYLGGQLLMNLHTSGRTVNFAENLEFLSHHLLSVFFFNTLQHPIPKIQTCHVRDDYIKYFSRTNPLKLFNKHAHIEYYHLPLSEARLQEILETWWENNKNRIEHKFNSNSSFSKWLNKIDYFGKYRRNDQYFMRIYFNRLYSSISC